MVSSEVFHLPSSMASFAAVCSEPSISLIPFFFNCVQLLRLSETDFPKVQVRCSARTVFMFLQFFTSAISSYLFDWNHYSFFWHKVNSKQAKHETCFDFLFLSEMYLKKTYSLKILWFATGNYSRQLQICSAIPILCIVDRTWTTVII